MRMTEADLARFQKNSGRAAKAAKQPKYRNVRTKIDGITFDSRLEANRYLELKALKAAGQIEWFLRQVPIDCGGGVVYRVDFQIKWRTTLLRPAVITFEDTTGMLTQAKANKLRQIRALHGIDVELVASAGR